MGGRDLEGGVGVGVSGGFGHAALPADAPLLLRLPIKLAAVHIVRGRLLPWQKAQLALVCRQAHALACASMETLVLRDACFAGGGSGNYSLSLSGSISGDSAVKSHPGGPATSMSGMSLSSSGGSSNPGLLKAPFLGCTSVVLRPRTMAMLSKIVSGLLVPGHLLHTRLPSVEEVAIEIHDVLVAQCDLSLHITSIALHAKGVRRLRIDQPGLFTIREAAAVARMPDLESLVLMSTQGLEPGALATLANGSTSSSGALSSLPSGGLRGQLRTLHLEIVSDELPISCSSSGEGDAWVGAPLSPQGPSNRQLPGPPPRLSAADEMALQAFGGSLEALAMIAMGPQVQGAITRPWEPLLAEAAEAGPGGAVLKRLALRGCGLVGSAALAAASDIASLEQIDLSGSVATQADIQRLTRISGLVGLGISPLQVGPTLLEELAKGCPNLVRLSVGGLIPPPSEDGGPIATMPVLPSVREVQLLGCCMRGPQLLSRVGGLSNAAVIASAFPALSVLEIDGVWQVDGPAVSALCDLVGARASRLRRLHLAGSAERPLHAPTLAPLLATPTQSTGATLACVELLNVEGLDDAWLADVVARAPTWGRCVFRDVRELALGGVPPPPFCPMGVPPPVPVLAPPPQVAKSGAKTGAKPSNVAAAAAAAPLAAPILSDKGLVKLFGCQRLRRLVLHHFPGISLLGITALTRGVGALDRITCVACTGVASEPRRAVATVGVFGSRVVDVETRSSC